MTRSRRTWRWLAIAAVIAIGCEGRDAADSTPTPRIVASHTAVAIPPAASAAKADPWNPPAPPADPDAPPSLAELHARAEKLCPRVTAPFFYRVEKAGRTSFILGSHHVSVSLAKFPPIVDDQFRRAKLAVFETPPDGEGTDVSHAEPIDVEAALGPALWRRYIELAGRDAAKASAHDRVSIASLRLALVFEDPSQMLDEELTQEAKRAGIRTRGLESHQFQRDLIEKLFDLRMLRAFLASPDTRADNDRIDGEDLVAYCTGADKKPGFSDHDRAQFQAAGYSAAELDAMDDELVFQRNAKWIPELEDIFAAGDAFVTVGCDHLKGPHGVLALLAARGYTITRVEK